MTFLPDVNIWIALTSDRHLHHAVAKDWLRTVDEGQIAFCRLSELGFLRLLTNVRVMGVDVVSATNAWKVYDDWRSDARVTFLYEPPGFSGDWRRAGDRVQGGPNTWTDAYLAAFALRTEATVVTLDRAFASAGDAAVKHLIQSALPVNACVQTQRSH